MTGQAIANLNAIAAQAHAVANLQNIAASATVEAARLPELVGVGAPTLVSGDTINIDVDARGAQDPEAVANAVTEAARALAPHKAKMRVRLSQRGG